MEKDLIETIAVLEKLNERLQAFGEKELNQQKNNVHDFMYHRNHLKELLEKMKIKYRDNQLPREELIYLLLTYKMFVSQFEQMEELLEKMVCALPDED